MLVSEEYIIYSVFQENFETPINRNDIRIGMTL